ncbi:AAA family ATPase [Cytobacillus sp. S13-E01]|uniref:AAA family ATPase n=1 Tax=Cytobacillus sp. S13-E01 TaxID=3031326 RepID=UPI0023D8B8DD|nr:AAA family ATPase [Cytobacillus sp. S13-E01]MDF0725598.1 AAA family ATPase [Cytobacillus sp. S13-E01]
MYLKKITLLKENISSFHSYPFSIPVFKELNELNFKSTVTFFVGENGSGKSTLLEAIATQIGFNKAGGSQNNFFEIEDTVSSLAGYLRLSWLPKISNGFFLRAETFYDFASYLNELQRENPSINVFSSYGGKSLHEQSHGESFLSLFKNRFGKKGIYLLDEPEAALSPARQLALLKVIHDLEQEGASQFIIATHSPILLGYPNATILHFDGSIHEIDYEDTEHYQLTKYFLNNREGMLNKLLNDTD